MIQQLDDRLHVLPSHRKVAGELTDSELETLILAGEAESSPAFLLALVAEYDRRASVGAPL